MKFSKMGALLLGIWLVLQGAIPLLRLHFSGSDIVLELVAIVAGVLILLGR